MLLTPDVPSTATPLVGHDSVFVLVLTMTLVLATTTFFGPFALAAIAAGLILGTLLHHHPADHSATGGVISGEPTGTINIAAIRVGGDAGGLIFVLGSIVVLGLGLPMLRWFLIASLAAASVLAAARIVMRRPA